jgi:uncharacterized protein
MSDELLVRCVCGWETVGTKPQVVAATQEHGRAIHNMAATPDEVMAMAGPAELAVVDVPEARRFEAHVGSKTIGFTRYAQRDGAIQLLHTEIDPSVEGHGFGSKLAVGVLRDVTSRGLSVVVRCPFIAAYVRRHPADYPGIELRD